MLASPHRSNAAQLKIFLLTMPQYVFTEDAQAASEILMQGGEQGFRQGVLQASELWQAAEALRHALPLLSFTTSSVGESAGGGP